MGKAGLKVPLQVLDGPLVYDTILSPGDVLYMPRGFVHQAKTLNSENSFHVTIALPSQDWTLAGAVTTATQHTLSQIVDYRMAMPLSLFTTTTTDTINNTTATSDDWKVMLQHQLDDALERIRQQVSVERIAAEVQEKTRCHNERALQKRMTIIHKQQQNDGGCSIVGKTAATSVTLNTVVRASREEEKASVVIQQPRGLRVREETANVLLGVVEKLKSNPSMSCRVSDFLSLLNDGSDESLLLETDLVCDLTLVSFARCCVELGGMAIVK